MCAVKRQHIDKNLKTRWIFILNPAGDGHKKGYLASEKKFMGGQLFSKKIFYFLFHYPQPGFLLPLITFKIEFSLSLPRVACERHPAIFLSDLNSCWFYTFL